MAAIVSNLLRAMWVNCVASPGRGGFRGGGIEEGGGVRSLDCKCVE